MKKLLIATLLVTFNTVALADNVIVTQTSTWKSVPITVDAEKHVYTFEGTLPESDFYYTYPGYRCLTEKREIAGVDALLFHAGVASGSDIYCYPDE